MPELPEVESVRAGLARHVVGRTVTAVEVFDPRPLRRQKGGAEAFVRALTGRVLTAAVRRGKLMWLPLDDATALSAHLGMSGQLLVRATAPSGGARPAPDPSQYLAAPGEVPVDLTATRAPSLVRDLSVRPRHLRVRLSLSGREGDPGWGRCGTDGPAGVGGPALDLVDQRMLGGLHLTRLVPTDDGGPGGQGSAQALVPEDATHIARDLLDPYLDRTAVVERMCSSSRAVKSLLMDQSVVSGVGNIYADEGLWAARVHGLRQGRALGPRVTARVLEETCAVMRRALAAGGTSFDALYVDAEGAAGFFARSLAAYGRQGQPCRRCGTPLRTEAVGGRSHTSCPRCQTRPRTRRRPA
ncbi:bifunctional DNA-formamidopyrimidine glycosylase/DNA-(apurinic or apyrimidinic site) lyase [Actinomyces sp. W5033]|uniref:bifunctional DNA-formamidopyrimidine glycosylase/DNA-(apurinic or apyrimidinic site) lyase n=1 Tax=Actinomyces sp. W5033 TaxID=3446479 RepID=UPI003EDE7CE0